MKQEQILEEIFGGTIHLTKVMYISSIVKRVLKAGPRIKCGILWQIVRHRTCQKYQKVRYSAAKYEECVLCSNALFLSLFLSIVSQFTLRLDYFL